MTAKLNTAEGGTAGTTATTTNTGGGSGDAANGFPGTSAPAFTASPTLYGSLAYAFQGASAATCIWQWTGFSGSDAGLNFSLRITASPTQTTEIAQIRTSSAAVARVLLTSGGKLQLNDGANTSVFVASASLSTNTTYDVRVRAVSGSSTTTGRLELDYSTGGSTVQTMTPLTAANVGTSATISDFRLGKLTATTWADTFFLDRFRANDSAGGLLSNVSPPQLVENDSSYYVVDLTSSISGSGGALTYTASAVSGPTLTYTQPTPGIFKFVPDSSTAAVYNFTVAEFGNGTAGPTSVTIPAGSGTAPSNGYSERVKWTGTAWV